jgi:hypothetical protein
MRGAVMGGALLIVVAVLGYAASASASAPGEVVGWGAEAQHPPTPIGGIPFCRTLERAGLNWAIGHHERRWEQWLVGGADGRG